LLLSFALSSLATVEAGLGLSMTARARAEAARARGRAAGMGSAKLYSAAVIALVAMGDGDAQEARGALEPLLGELADFGLAEPGTVLWQPELIEAYARLGMSAEARRELAVLAEQAHGPAGPGRGR